MTPEQIVAAAFAGAEKRAAAEKALAAILDPTKRAQVRDDALKAKPTTTAGRLIRAANNADARAEKIKAGGGGDGRALRVQGIRKAGPGALPDPDRKVATTAAAARLAPRRNRRRRR